MSDQILISRADGVCEVRFNRPEKRNAITFAMYEALDRGLREAQADADRKSTRLNSSHRCISYAVFCLKKKKQNKKIIIQNKKTNKKTKTLITKTGDLPKT